jgi:hypothetical protein
MRVVMPNLSDMERQSTPLAESTTLTTLRRIILGLVTLGTAGMMAELLLVGHVEDANQLIPLAIGAMGLAAALWVVLSGGEVALRTLQFVMLLYAGSGVIGITLHYKASEAIQLEADPHLHGIALARKAVTAAAPPALAPGLMVQLALLGLAYTYKHPSLRATTSTSKGVSGTEDS